MIIPSLVQAEYGDIILFEPTRWISALQAKIDSRGQKKQPYSHGAIFWGHEGDIPLMIEAINKCGTHISKVQNWRNFIIVRPDKSMLMSKEKLITYVGKRYDFSKLYSVFENRFLGVPLFVDNDEEVICTELVNLAYNYTLTPKGMCTPVTLANAIL